MPREFIHSKYPEDCPELGLRVDWGRDSGHVQLATLNADGVHLELGSEAKGWLANGWFVQLDRSGINDLIRVLRRARDQAYGRDE